MDEVIIKNKTATKSISWQNTYSMGELCIDRNRMISNEVGGCLYSIEGTMMTFSRLILKELFRENTEKQANSSLNLLILKRENGSLALTESRRCTSPFICFFQINEKGDDEGTTWAVLALGVSCVQPTTRHSTAWTAAVDSFVWACHTRLRFWCDLYSMDTWWHNHLPWEKNGSISPPINAYENTDIFSVTKYLLF